MSSTRFILMALSLQRMHLGEFLADAGWEVVEGQWGLPEQLPLVVVTEDLRTFHGQPFFVEAVGRGLVGSVGLGPLDGNDEMGPKSSPKSMGGTRSYDALLPIDVSGRELATVVDLVAQLTILRRQQSQQLDECQRWIELALHDALTGLPNRRSWDAALEQALLDRQTLSLAMIDVDCFKQINDQDGHTIGDQVLQEAATAMRSELRRSDFVARLGGDEFGLLIPGASVAEATSILDRLRTHVSDHLANVHLPVATLSAGLVFVPATENRDAPTLMAAASRSLRLAKQQQKNRTVAVVG